MPFSTQLWPFSAQHLTPFTTSAIAYIADQLPSPWTGNVSAERILQPLSYTNTPRPHKKSPSYLLLLQYLPWVIRPAVRNHRTSPSPSAFHHTDEGEVPPRYEGAVLSQQANYQLHTLCFPRPSNRLKHLDLGPL